MNRKGFAKFGISAIAACVACAVGLIIFFSTNTSNLSRCVEGDELGCSLYRDVSLEDVLKPHIGRLAVFPADPQVGQTVTVSYLVEGARRIWLNERELQMDAGQETINGASTFVVDRAGVSTYTLTARSSWGLEVKSTAAVKVSPKTGGISPQSP